MQHTMPIGIMFEILYVLIHIIFISPINVMFGWKKRSNRSANIDRTKYKTYYHINIFYFVKKKQNEQLDHTTLIITWNVLNLSLIHI